MKRTTIIVLILFGIVLLSFVSWSLLQSQSNPKQVVTSLLEKADITIGGANPWDITVLNQNLYARVLKEGSLGLGESYMDGWWDCAALDQFFCRVLSAQLDTHLSWNWTLIISFLKATFINLQSKERAFQVAEQHYDLSNELFEKMLDSRMIYSCAYWKHAHNLEQAQKDKLELICKKLCLEPGMRLLDIGCGWGGLAHYAAREFGVEVVGITVSEQQASYARDYCAGLPVEIRLQDYRDLNGEQFDRIVSVGMFEHVGSKNYKEFINIVHACLKDNGLFLLHTIGGNTTLTSGDPWITKYIFPNGMLPSMVQITQAIEGLFIVEDWHNFGADYDKTLMAWHDNFIKHWDEIKAEYDQRFYRMWNYYLLSCAGLFRARKAQLWQVVLSKNGQIGGYESVR
ncbi:MAG TPA: cyclopropane fatty acyl phospholipid synthase [Candidatus Babeliales bacterium]|nr:cyclopropane fatty acyl phospholipid synthase [Candidatus Babeliales bacterium]